MMVTDLDGTLLDERSRLPAANRKALERLATAGVVRVITTGRNLYSARQVIDPNFPIDFLSFSSGAGTVEWRTQELISSHSMSATDGHVVTEALLRRGMDFMIHSAIPANHYFAFHRSNDDNPDFDRRCQRYQDFATPWDGQPPAEPLCQILAVEPEQSKSHYSSLAAELATLTVILTTSPLDHASRWIEIFPAHVSKSQTAHFLAQRLNVAPNAVAAIGNDYNDRDLLAWAPNSFVVANAPAELRERYTVVSSHNDGGFAEAADAFLKYTAIDAQT